MWYALHFIGCIYKRFNKTTKREFLYFIPIYLTSFQWCRLLITIIGENLSKREEGSGLVFWFVQIRRKRGASTGGESTASVYGRIRRMI